MARFVGIDGVWINPDHVVYVTEVKTHGDDIRTLIQFSNISRIYPWSEAPGAEPELNGEYVLTDVLVDDVVAVLSGATPPSDILYAAEMKAKDA